MEYCKTRVGNRRKSQKKGDDNKNEKNFFKELGILIISICRFFYLKKATLLFDKFNLSFGNPLPLSKNSLNSLERFLVRF